MDALAGWVHTVPPPIRCSVDSRSGDKITRAPACTTCTCMHTSKKMGMHALCWCAPCAVNASSGTCTCTIHLTGQSSTHAHEACRLEHRTTMDVYGCDCVCGCTCMCSAAPPLPLVASVHGLLPQRSHASTTVSLWVRRMHHSTALRMRVCACAYACPCACVHVQVRGAASHRDAHRAINSDDVCVEWKRIQM